LLLAANNLRLHFEEARAPTPSADPHPDVEVAVPGLGFLTRGHPIDDKAVPH